MGIDRPRKKLMVEKSKLKQKKKKLHNENDADAAKRNKY